MKAYYYKAILILVLSVFGSHMNAQEANEDTDTAYIFEYIYDHPATEVKDQAKSGTCWDFAGISFIESELLRMGAGEHDLSEMYVVRCIYPAKAVKYVRNHGKSNFSMGGQAHDVTQAIKACGIVPEEVYQGLIGDFEVHNHGEMDIVLKSFCDAIIKKRGGQISATWGNAYDAILDAYLGEKPVEFIYKGITYTPTTFTKSLEINPDAYIEITSYANYPFYTPVNLEVPDNWDNQLYYNLPLDDLIEVMEYALKKGYTIVWDGDVSNRNFSFKNGVAIVPAKKWSDKSDKEKNKAFKKPETEQDITQDIRQKAFDNQTSTDDHLMHIVGLAEDQNGTKYFKTKNSWGPDSNDFGGYINMSEAYVRLKTIAIMIHKEALPKKLAKKLNLY